jgi:hypothetical protein
MLMIGAPARINLSHILHTHATPAIQIPSVPSMTATVPEPLELSINCAPLPLLNINAKLILNLYTTIY